MSVIRTLSFDAPPVDRREILRYAGVRGRAEEIERLVESCIDEARDAFSYKVCYRELDRLECAELIRSESLEGRLADCESVIIFAATVGLGIDRLIARYATVSPTKSLIFASLGAERIEALCDAFERNMRESLEEKGKALGARFSAGYSDLSLDIQKDIFLLLDCHRRIGLTLSESMLMSPSKSVTAFMGVKDCSDSAVKDAKCVRCDRPDCEYRRT